VAVGFCHKRKLILGKHFLYSYNNLKCNDCNCIFCRKQEELDTYDRRPKSPVFREAGADTDAKIRNDIQSSYTVSNYPVYNLVLYRFHKLFSF
jgi:hypothetical protein